MLVRWCSFAAAFTCNDVRLHAPRSRLSYSISHTIRVRSAPKPAGNAMSSSADNDAAASPSPTSYAQHIILRGDMLEEWGVGPMMTQAAHCSVAAIETYRHLPQTQSYLSEIDNMRKVTWKAKNEAWLEKIAARFDEAEIEYKLWIEQPENIKVGLATRPVLREETEKIFKGNGIAMWR